MVVLVGWREELWRGRKGVGISGRYGARDREEGERIRGDGRAIERVRGE